MKKQQLHLNRMLSLFLALTLILVALPGFTASAEETTEEEIIDPVVVVALGDSYASGEGIEPFYGQDKAVANKVNDLNWLAHRSMLGWPALLQIPGVEGVTGNYNADFTDSDVCKFYFAASSGARTVHFSQVQQDKTVRQKGVNNKKKFTQYMPLQMDIFNQITDTVDYVTLSIGGNDVDFAGIITTCATGSTYLGSKKLDTTLAALWANFGETKANIKQVYAQIAAAAPEAAILVTGYPTLLDNTGKGFLISKKEAVTINQNVSMFNDELEALVNECRAEGMNIYFVDVEAAFAGHEAYTDDPWINKIILGAQSQELDYKAVASAYSIHPNATGAQVYASCVNAKIAEIEAAKAAANAAEELPIIEPELIA